MLKWVCMHAGPLCVLHSLSVRVLLLYCAPRSALPWTKHSSALSALFIVLSTTKLQSFFLFYVVIIATHTHTTVRGEMVTDIEVQSVPCALWLFHRVLEQALTTHKPDCLLLRKVVSLKLRSIIVDSYGASSELTRSHYSVIVFCYRVLV